MKKKKINNAPRYSWRHMGMPLLILLGLALVFVLPSAPGPVSQPISSRPIQENINAKPTQNMSCDSPYIIDGDTFDCGGKRIRLAGIDTPELPNHCRPGRRCTSGDPYAALNHLQSLSRGTVNCLPLEMDAYGRFIALCEANGLDLSCAMIKSGHTVMRYRHINCSYGSASNE